MTLNEARSLLAIHQRNVRDTLALIEAEPGFMPFRDQLAHQEAGVILLRRYIADRTTIRVGVDPAMLDSGFAYRLPGERWPSYGNVLGAENIPSAPLFQSLRDANPKHRIALTVEYPTWRGKGTDAVRAAANCWIRALKAAFPRRVSVLKVTPARWMGATIPGYRKLDKDAGERPSSLYVPRAHELAGVASCIGINENAAAAICILHWAEGAGR